ncbi:hypothetical protein BVRB_1g011810 [Beta vulgaris subsp. vulgaris]|nr:hypothetical protein BVRB_1g011810 [Beta vulgaris subsp. vulgaris]
MIANPIKRRKHKRTQKRNSSTISTFNISAILAYDFL